MRNRPRAAWKLAVIFVSCVIASYVTVTRRGGLFGVGGSRALLAQTRGSTRTPDPNFDLTRMTVLRHVMLEINNSYVDPARVHPREMLLKGLDAIQRSVAQVLVQHEENAPTVTVRVDTHEQVFRVDDVNAPWDLEPRWREIFTFLQARLRGSDVDLRDLEYTAANGMLRTLDPHSVALTPEALHEMQIQTSGHFGGLGIVISIRDGLLTVMNPMPDTPASRAGLRRFDRIVKINEESTANMSLSEAVNRLRGPEGSRVIVWTTRAGTAGWAQPRRLELTRAVINVRSVENRMLANNVGYAKIRSFSETTGEEMTRALAQMRQQGMRSLVLDMRGNPGGLLEQAITVTDLFLRDGTIVVTAGNRREEREPREAEARGTEPDYPIVVLIDGGSASASEIVAGALKNNNRALIVGSTSFGKGSVQTIRNLPDGGALKITIAQYLTPGDVSIQGVGITPDIELRPTTVDARDMDIDADRVWPREADLSAHLTNTRARDGGAPAETLSYFFASEDRDQLRLRGADDLSDDGFREDFPVRFARDVLAAGPRMGRREQLADARPVLERLRGEQLAAMSRALQALNVNWEDGPDQGAADLQVAMRTSRPENTGAPGEEFDLTVTVTNRGRSPVYRLRATVKSDNPLFENRELVFGRVNPGETRTWTTPLGICEFEGYRPGSTSWPAAGTPKRCLVPRAALSRTDGIRLEWSESHGHVPTTEPLRVSIRGIDRPVFAYGWQVAETARGGNGDGRVNAGEQLGMYLVVRNVGRGRSFSTQASIKNLSGPGVLLHDARFHIDNMAPGEERRVLFTFNVNEGFNANEVKLELTIEDEDLREVVSQKVRLPVVRAAAAAVQPATGSFVAAGETELREAPAADARVVLRAPAGASLAIQAQVGDFVRVDAGGGRPAWALRSAGNGTRAAQARALAAVMHNSPPTIEPEGSVALAVRGNSVVLRGAAADEARVLDLYIFVGPNKVFYRSNRDRSGDEARRLPFEATLPLRPGANIVSVIAREDDDSLSRRTFIIRRDGANGELLSTPRHGEDDED